MKNLRTVRGVNDLMPEVMAKHSYIKNVGLDTCKLFCYEEIDTPIFEFAELFTKPLGETSDIITKENYIFNDRSENTLMLRPEGTTSVVRAAINAGLTQSLPKRFCYFGPMFRYERPQKGRLRQFHQLGTELLGIDNFYGDVEVISLAYQFLKNLQISDKVILTINSLGDEESRFGYRQALVSFLGKYKDQLSKESKIRLVNNPLRILDSKHYNDKIILNEAPKYRKYLNKNSRVYFENLCKSIDELKIPYKIDDKLVRGLDYYMHTTFEFKTNLIGSQDAVLAGGRYDGLSKMISGYNFPGIGWAAGIERLALLIEKQYQFSPQVVIISQSNDINTKLLNFHKSFVENGFKTEMMYSGSLAKKLKRADKLSAKFAIIVGEDELKKDMVQLKNLVNGIQKIMTFDQVIKILKKEFNY